MTICILNKLTSLIKKIKLKLNINSSNNNKNIIKNGNNNTIINNNVTTSGLNYDGELKHINDKMKLSPNYIPDNNEFNELEKVFFQDKDNGKITDQKKKEFYNMAIKYYNKLIKDNPDKNTSMYEKKVEEYEKKLEEYQLKQV